MHKLFSSENFEEAKKLNDSLMPLHKAIFIETSPSPVKYILSKMNLINYEIRLPLVKIRNDTKETIDNVIKDFGIL